MVIIRHNGPLQGVRRIFAVLLCLCYVFNPVLPCLKDVLHSFSHALQVPDIILTHSAPLAGSPGEPHQQQYHVRDQKVHEHEIIEFLTSVDNSSSGNKEHSGTPTLEYPDKHLSCSTECVAALPSGITGQTYRAIRSIASAGYPGSSLKPPIT